MAPPCVSPETRRTSAPRPTRSRRPKRDLPRRPRRRQGSEARPCSCRRVGPLRSAAGGAWPRRSFASMSRSSCSPQSANGSMEEEPWSPGDPWGWLGSSSRASDLPRRGLCHSIRADGRSCTGDNLLRSASHPKRPDRPAAPLPRRAARGSRIPPHSLRKRLQHARSGGYSGRGANR